MKVKLLHHKFSLSHFLKSVNFGTTYVKMSMWNRARSNIWFLKKIHTFKNYLSVLYIHGCFSLNVSLMTTHLSDAYGGQKRVLQLPGTGVTHSYDVVVLMASL